MKIRLAGVIPESIVDGPGIRYTIFTQGCPHKCMGCHNPKTHDYNSGFLLDIDELAHDINSRSYLEGITISGGEPFIQAKECLELISKLSNNLNIIVYTGFTLEHFLKSNNNDVIELLKKTDYLIDGPFENSLRDLSLSFRGSSNQRIVNLKETFKNNKLVLNNSI